MAIGQGKKRAGAQYVTIKGARVRLLSDAEAEAFHARVRAIWEKRCPLVKIGLRGQVVEIRDTRNLGHHGHL